MMPRQTRTNRLPDSRDGSNFRTLQKKRCVNAAHAERVKSGRPPAPGAGVPLRPGFSMVQSPSRATAETGPILWKQIGQAGTARISPALRTSRVPSRPSASADSGAGPNPGIFVRCCMQRRRHPLRSCGDPILGKRGQGGEVSQLKYSVMPNLFAS